MAAELMLTESSPTAQSRPTQGPKAPRSSPGANRRRHSLPHHFLPPGLWSANASAASLIESELAAQGEHILDEATVANRISALRQLKGANRPGHRYAKSTGARSSTFSQPVIVRTYSASTRPRSQQRDLVTVKKEKGLPAMKSTQTELKLPPVEAFTFKGIMDEIRHGVSDDLERIAEICARSKYSLSNQYEVHMPPHGQGEAFMAGPVANGSGPTLQAIDDEQTRLARRGAARRTKSVAYGTLETIMSSSRSSNEDKSKKKSAAELVEEVRGRAAKNEIGTKERGVEDPVNVRPTQENPTMRGRSKSATFASIVIVNALSSTDDGVSSPVLPTLLVSEPARPQTSPIDLESIPAFGGTSRLASPALQSLMFPRQPLSRNESRAPLLGLTSNTWPSLLGTLSSWLPWSRNSGKPGTFYSGVSHGSHAEGSLRELLKVPDTDRKGKSVGRN